MTLGLAALCLLAQLSGLVHLAFVAHVPCAEHGELVEAGAPTSALPLQRAADDGAAVAAEPSPADLPAHSHDHCAVTALRRTPVCPLKSYGHIDLSGDPGRGVRVSRESRAARAVIPLLAVAPKSSPPAS